MTTAILFLMFFGFMVIGMPIAFALGLASVLTIVLLADTSLASMAQALFSAFDDHYTLQAIPFFILASAFMSTGGVARRLVDFAIACVGHFRGGLAMASVLACMFFAAVSGSSPATVVAVGSVVIAGMVQAGYSKKFAAGVICNAGTLGILIPPSIVMVVYAAAVEVSVGRMFLAGIVPGMIAGLMLMTVIWFRARQKNMPKLPKVSTAEWGRAAYHALPGLGLIAIIFVGIYGGIFTPTEAAAVAAVYAFIAACFIYRDIGPLKSPAEGDIRNGHIRWLTALPHAFVHRDVFRVMVDGGRTTIMLMFLIANAIMFAHVLTSEQIPQALAESILAAGLEPWMFLIVVNVVLLIAGNFMEPSAIVLILAPIFFPIAVEMGIDPIHLGIIMVVNMEIGLITPPVGLNLFVTAGITGMSLTRTIGAAMPWLLVLLVFLVLVTYVPIISTGLYQLVLGPETVSSGLDLSRFRN